MRLQKKKDKFEIQDNRPPKKGRTEQTNGQGQQQTQNASPLTCAHTNLILPSLASQHTECLRFRALLLSPALPVTLFPHRLIINIISIISTIPYLPSSYVTYPRPLPRLHIKPPSHAAVYSTFVSLPTIPIAASIGISSLPRPHPSNTRARYRRVVQISSGWISQLRKSSYLSHSIRMVRTCGFDNGFGSGAHRVQVHGAVANLAMA
jgi:hypothetical protein